MHQEENNKIYLRFSKLDRNISEQDYKNLVQKIIQDIAEINVDQENITLIVDKEYGGYRNFCFVMLPDSATAITASRRLDQSVTEEGQELTASIARPKTDAPKPFKKFERNNGGFGGGRSGGFGGGRGRDGGNRY